MPLLHTAALGLPFPDPLSLSASLHPISLLVQESEPQFLSTSASLPLFVAELLGLWFISGTKTVACLWP